MKKKRRELEAKNYFCIHCLLYNEMYTEAEYMVWDEYDKKALPLCRFHFMALEKMEEREEASFFTFSEN